MSTERDPLATASALGSSVFTSENAAAAAKYTKEQAQVLANMISDGNTSIRVLALLGGVAMTVTSGFGVINRFLGLNWISAIVELYTFLMGLAVVALEARSGQIPLLPRKITDLWEARMRKYALFLSFVSGRGGLYFVGGTLQLSQMSLVDLIVGSYMALVGLAYIIIGRQTAKKLSDLRKSSISETALRKKFASADTQGSGSLSMEQFQAMMAKEFGLEFSRRELEVSFNHLDSIHERDGRVTLDEFLEWWQTCDFDDANMAAFRLSV